jgi:NAD(P)-dependent dehydrogenase (short-subunit alcohol dehydrogenase family)
MPLDDFERPIATAVRMMFLTSRAAARHMIMQRLGVILIFGGSGNPMPNYYLGGSRSLSKRSTSWAANWHASSDRTASAW